MAWRSPGGTRIRLLVNTCNADLQSRVDENEHEIHVLVTARHNSSDDCADAVEIVLSAPLGDRTLIDDFDSDPIVAAEDASMSDTR